MSAARLHNFDVADEVAQVGVAGERGGNNLTQIASETLLKKPCRVVAGVVSEGGGQGSWKIVGRQKVRQGCYSSRKTRHEVYAGGGRMA